MSTSRIYSRRHAAVEYSGYEQQLAKTLRTSGETHQLGTPKRSSSVVEGVDLTASSIDSMTTPQRSTAFQAKKLRTECLHSIQ